MVNGKRVASLVAMTDEAEQTRLRRPVAHAYSLSTMVEYEGLVDSTIALFLSRLDEKYAETGKVLNLGLWLQFFAFDVIGELTFSKRLGFLANGSDVENIIHSIGVNFDRISVLGQMPWLDLCLWKNPVYLKFFAKAVPSPIISFGQRRLEERLNTDLEADLSITEISDPQLREKDLERSQQTKPDFLTRFLHLREQHTETISDQQVLAYLFANVNAGSDTTASILRAIFYYLLKNPSSLRKLQEELETAIDAGQLSVPFPSWMQSQALPYLSAVIKEALRLNPALALPLERIVPPSGLNLDLESPRKSLDPMSYFFLPGTVVGINPWVYQRDPRVFGTDPLSWKPDRWLHANAKHMENELLTFGAGKRTCLGRNIAMLELHKLVPAVILRYDIKLADESKEWTLRNSWALGQEGVDVVISRKSKDLSG
jgi:hypothetical protein